MTQGRSRDEEDSGVPASVAYAQSLPALQGVLNHFDLAGLLRGAWRCRVVASTTEPATAAQVASATGLAEDHVLRVLTALVAHGVVDRDGASFVVSDRWRPLLLDPAPISVPTLLGYAAARSRMVEDAVTGDRDYWSADLADQAAYAISFDPESVHGRELLALAVDQDVELRELLGHGGVYLELGCGAGGFMCSLLRLYPTLRATGVELSSALAHVARARAQRLGVADRMEVVLGDAAELDRPAAYDFALWRQYFFAGPTRADALRVLHRSLRPGGVLTVPLRTEPLTEVSDLRTDDGQVYAVDAMLHGSWGVPERGGAALQEELTEAGFDDPRHLEFSVGRVIRVVRP